MKRSNNTSGTSFYGVTLTVTPQKLIDVLGEPDFFDNDGQDKVNMEYNLETEDGIAFTIYDWKEYRSLQMDQKVKFHIGGFSYTQCIEAKEELMEGF
tara:strand:- start:81 stop:371 length:291 start_codon:yes stop_codon:yes gene_type:complete